MQLSKSFMLQELVNPDIYNNPFIGDRCADFIHAEAANTLESIKAATGDVITINDWLWDGRYVDSGLRMPVVIPTQLELMDVIELHSSDHNEMYKQIVKLFKGVGAPLSSHREGCGFDLKFKYQSPQAAHALILADQHLFPSITRMEAIEKTPRWVHIEIGAARAPGVDIVVFNP